jgi:hypothetical protein
MAAVEKKRKEGGDVMGTLTLRDYFAAKALQGMNARDAFDPGQAAPQQRARLAYIEADAMLKARDL